MKVPLFVLGLSLTAAAGVVACGASSSEDDGESGNAALSNGPQGTVTGKARAKEGEACGGNGDTPIAICAAGLECFEPSDLEPGKCRKARAKEGEACGGDGDT